MVQFIRYVVTHLHPDFDAWLCYWLFTRFVPGAEGAELRFVPAGTRWGEHEDPTIVHVDTGLGKFDQHGKCLLNSSSALLITEAFGIDKDPGLRALLQLAVVVDNAKEIEPTSIVCQIRAYPAIIIDQQTRQPDWHKIKQRVFEIFEIVYHQENDRHNAQQEFAQNSRWHTTNNGLRLALLDDRPHLRGPAFNAGADVVLWFFRRGNDRFYVGLVINNQSITLNLDYVAYCLRWWEAHMAGISLDGDDTYLYGHGTVGPAGQWFLHDSGNLILYGSKTHPLPASECTRLTRKRIEDIVFAALEQTTFIRL